MKDCVLLAATVNVTISSVDVDLENLCPAYGYQASDGIQLSPNIPQNWLVDFFTHTHTHILARI